MAPEKMLLLHVAFPLKIRRTGPAPGGPRRRRVGPTWALYNALGQRLSPSIHIPAFANNSSRRDNDLPTFEGDEFYLFQPTADMTGLGNDARRRYVGLLESLGRKRFYFINALEDPTGGQTVRRFYPFRFVRPDRSFPWVAVNWYNDALGAMVRSPRMWGGFELARLGALHCDRASHRIHLYHTRREYSHSKSRRLLESRWAPAFDPALEEDPQTFGRLSPPQLGRYYKRLETVLTYQIGNAKDVLRASPAGRSRRGIND